jgi:hypothetical protein
MKQNPFSLFDFMGYFTPGATFFYMLYIITYCQGDPVENITDLQTILTSFPAVGIEGVLIFLISSYTIGHIISYLSSLTIETYSIWKYGYPSKSLLDIKGNGYWTGISKAHSYIWRIVLPIAILPITLLDIIFGNFLGFKIFYTKKLDSFLITVITFKIQKLLEHIGLPKSIDFKDNTKRNGDFFRIIMHYTYENSKTHQSKFTNYVALYGLLRAFSLIFNCLSIYLLFSIACNEYSFIKYVVLLSTSMIAYIFFMGYMKFYRRYTLEGLMVMTIDPLLK